MVNDEEDLLRVLQSFVKDNLNDNIDAINTEKDDFKIDNIDEDDEHFVFSGELLELPNHAFVNFAISGEIETSNNYDNIKSTSVLVVEICFDDDKKPNTYFKSLRYMRALYQTILDFEASTNEVGGLMITKVIPMLAVLRGRHIVVSGVSISVAIG